MTDKSELLFLGAECHHSACHLHDFLPFNCPACSTTFCQDHFLPSHHDCQSPLPASMVDRLAPTCPMCNQVVPTHAAGPDQAVERHILGGTCVAMDGGEERRKAELKRKKERGEVCYRRGCTKVLIVPMACLSCHHQFCPSHRSSQAHSCSPNATPSGSLPGSRISTPQPTSQPKSAMSRLLPSKQPIASSSKPAPIKPANTPKPPSVPAQPISAQIDARAAAAAAAMRRAGQDAKVPFVKTKTEKRANLETNSQIQALKARHDKGLLSKTEELKYAELVGKNESGRRKGEKGKGDCIIA